MKILPPSVNLAEYKRNVYKVEAKHGQTFEDFKEPDAWAHVAVQLKKFDKIELVAEDGSFYAEGVVLKVTKTSAHVHFHIHANLNEKSEPELKEPTYYAEFAGPHARWRVVRRADGEVVESGIESKDDALSLTEKLNIEGE
ncbi:hypothetical protein PMPD1_3084 [Paramixta manurensis]|uniref:Uncharacterized protein n=1 Tax=Paramixta manurensis TaxID=2740817 RepID=A0A6M8UHZ5_9GAMM|nr:hypothetical protein PMPD1_3084 [Erwiniaceae bacterium PD-1]